MAVDLRMPTINGATEKEQLAQIRSYLYQLIPQLQWALNTIDIPEANAALNATNALSATNENNDAYSSFNEIKSLIIKSADIVNAYYEEINHRLEGEYVAQSDFGKYEQTTSQSIKETSDGIQRLFENLQVIQTDIETLQYKLIDVNAYINQGLLGYDDNGVPIYGIEVGQKTEIGGVETFNKYARFTANKLSFYDSNGIEVAYISDKKLYITHVEIKVSFSQGNFVDTTIHDGSIVSKWVEGGNE